MKRNMRMNYSGLSTKQIVAVSLISIATITIVYRIDKLKDFVTDSSNGFLGFFN